MDTFAELELAIRARAPLIAVVSPEEERALERLLLPLAQKWREGRLFTWTITRGFRNPDGEETGLLGPDAASALEAIGGYEEPALFVLQDFHHYLENTANARRLRDLARALPTTGKHVILLCPRLRLSEDLEKEIVVLDYPPPGLDELGELLEEFTQSFAAETCALTHNGRERLLRATMGLTLDEASMVLAKAMVRDGALTDAGVDLVLAEKKQIVRRGGILEFYETDAGLDDVGGLNSLKAWLRRRQEAFSEEAADFGLPTPKGILLLGIQGCGKSLVAKSISREWQMPLLRLDLGRVFGRYIGESEAAIRRVIQTAEAVAPAVLWIDEIEKGFAGSTAEAHDTGVSARVLGTFLTWMQEKRKPVFVFATANQIRTLPPELLRKGRFDELFFVDLPSRQEREEILAVHLRKRHRDPAAFDLTAMAKQTDGYTGAEIEQAVNEALFTAFADGRRALRQDDLAHAAREIVPLSVTMKEAITAMRHWAHARARLAS